jgi:hypothetical protein
MARTPILLALACSLVAAPCVPAAAQAAPPRVVVLTGPGDRTASSSATLTLDSDRRSATFAARLDGAAWSRFHRSRTLHFEGLRAGRHVISVRGRSDGRPGPVRRVRFVVDHARPDTAFTGALRGGVVLRPASAISFSAREAGARYECRVDGGDFRVCASPMALTQLRPGRHTVAVRAIDAAGNADATPATRALTVDRRAAGGLFSDDFESGALIPRWNVVVKGTGSAQAQTETARSGGWAARFSQASASGSVAYARASFAAPVADVTVAESVRIDGDGATGGSVPLLRLFDAGGARVVNLYRQNVTGKVWAQHSGIYAQTKSTLPLGTWAAVEIRAAGDALQVTIDGQSVYQTTAATLGSVQTLQIGNEASAQAGTIFVDDVTATNTGVDDGSPPETTIDSAPGPNAPGGTANVTFSANEPGATFQCSLDQAAFAGCASPQNLSGLKAGAHTFAVRAIDAAGNVDPTAAETTWTSEGTLAPAILIADNQNRRIVITDYDGRLLWKFDNPTGEASSYSGPLGVRWLPNGHILATFGTGKVGEIDPATHKFVWITAGYKSDWFQSPYDALLLPDGKLAVGMTGNEGGRVVVYDRTTGTAVWKYLDALTKSVEYIPAGLGANTSRPTLLIGGRRLDEVVYNPAGNGDGTRVYRWTPATNVIHRAVLDRNGRSLIVSNANDLIKLDRPGQGILFRRNEGSTVGGEIRGNAMTADGYVFGYRNYGGGPSYVRFVDGNGLPLRSWFTLSDGSRLNLIWGLRTMMFPQ